MFYSKSFNINNNTKKKKSQMLYSAKRYRWMKYIVLPALIGFILLLVLMNVNFSSRNGTLDEKVMPTFTNSSFRALTITSVFVETTLPNINVNYQLKWTSGCYLRHPGFDKCVLTCEDNLETKLYNDIQSFLPYCNEDFDILFNFCLFYNSGKMTKNFLEGDFVIRNLTFDGCTFYEIENGAFDHASVHNLETITFSGNALSKFSEETFVGLNSLNYLKFRNNEFMKKPFQGTNFLLPIASTVNQVIIQQITTTNSYNPTSWLGGVSLEALKLLDMSGNNFANELNSGTFEKLVEIKELILSNCNILSIQLGTFDVVINTLSYLDLSNNKLTALSGEFLQTATLKKVQILLHNNVWNCTCENEYLIDYVKAAGNFANEPKCATPNQWKDMNLKSVEEKCREDTTTITTSSVTTETTEIVTESSTSSVTTETTDIGTESTTSSISTEITHTTDESSVTTESQQTTSRPIYTTTTTPKQTTNFPTTTEPSNKIEVSCYLSQKDKYYSMLVEDYDALFKVETIAPTKVQVTIFYYKLSQSLKLFYFQTQTGENVFSFPLDEIDGTWTKSITTQVETIDDLKNNQTYVFCLVSNGRKEISPFNCRAHHLALTPLIREAWLNKDQIWIFALVVLVIIIVCFAVGLLVTFAVLRWRPLLLRGSKRLVKNKNCSHQAFLLPKDLDDASAYETIRKLEELSPNVNDVSDNDNQVYKSTNDYLQFYKNFRMKKKITENLPPKQRAPPMPRTEAGSNFSSSVLDLNAHEYQSLEIYEEIY